MARRETPEEAWERMRDASRAGGRGDPSPTTLRDSGEGEEAAGAARRAPDRERAARDPVGAEPPRSEPQEPSAGDLVKQLSEQTKTLVKQEMRLAQTELQEKGKKLGIGAGMFGAGGLVAFFGAATLITAAVLGLASALEPWLAALIVGVVLLAGAGIAALMGKKQVEQATPPAPEQAIGSVKRDVDTVKRRARK